MHSLDKTILLLLILSISLLTNCGKDNSTPINKETRLIKEDVTTLTLLENRVDDPNIPDYVVTKPNWLIQAGLSISPGVVIAFEANGSLQVVGENGYLIAEGTSQQRIQFTGKEKTVGFWKGILIHSPDLRNQLHYCLVEYAGSDSLHENLPLTNIGVLRADDQEGTLMISSTISQYSGGHGLALNKKAGLHDFTLNEFRHNVLAAVQLPPDQVAQLDGSRYTLGNGYNGVEVLGGRITDKQTWSNLGGQATYKLLGSLLTYEELTISPNTVIQVSAEQSITTNGPNGLLIADASPTSEIIFEGVEKEPGFWEGFLFQNSEGNYLSYCTIANAGSERPSFRSTIPIASLTIIEDTEEAQLTLSHCLVTHGRGCGVAKNAGAFFKDVENAFHLLTNNDICTY